MSGLRGPSAKVGTSAKFGVAVFKASILDLLVGVDQGGLDLDIDLYNCHL